MPDILLSYASGDRERIRPLVVWLQSRGWSVWWDHDILPGQTWDEVIADALRTAACVVVVWTRASVASDWVRIEASSGREREVLVPVTLDVVELPLAFRLVQTASLVGWDGATAHEALDQIALGIARILGGAAPSVLQETRPLVSTTGQRVLDAAVSRQLPVEEPASLIAMIRRKDSGGLRAILEFDEEYGLSPSDVSSKTFDSEFPVDQNGRPRPLELLICLESPDFHPPSQEKIIRVPPSRLSVAATFLLTPKVEGNLIIQVEILERTACLASRLLHPGDKRHKLPFCLEGLHWHRRRAPCTPIGRF
jgi:hypothetical protein